MFSYWKSSAIFYHNRRLPRSEKILRSKVHIMRYGVSKLIGGEDKREKNILKTLTPLWRWDKCHEWQSEWE